MIDEFDEQEKMLIELFQLLFKRFDVFQININKLNDLLDEHNLKNILLDIEPSFLIIAQVDDLLLCSDNSFAIKFSNFVEIISCFDKYLKNSSEKFRFTRKLEIKILINPIELLKESKEQLIILGELILILSSISTKKNHYLDILNDADPDYVLNFLNFLEKYLYIEAKEERHSYNNKRKTFLKTKTLVINDDNEYKKKMLNNKISILEEELLSITQKNEELNDLVLELELKNRDLLREIEMLKLNNKNNSLFAEESYNDALLITTLKNDLVRKDIEIEDIKRMYDLKIKNTNDEMNKLINKIEEKEDKLSDLKSVRHENEKLKIKIKEFQMIKEKIADYNRLEAQLDEKNNLINKILADKTNYLTRIEELMAENNKERAKQTNIEFEKKKLEIELNELKKTDISIMYPKKKKTTNNLSVLEMTNNNHLENVLANYENQYQESDLQKISDLEEAINQLKYELSDVNKLYIEQINLNQDLLKSKDELYTNYQGIQLKLENEHSINEKLYIEIEKISLEKKKLELEIQKHLISIDKLENDKNKIFEEKMSSMGKIETLNKEKNKYLTEMNNIKIEAKNLKDRIEKMLSEKQKLVNDYKDLQIVNDKLRKSDMHGKRESIVKKGNSSSPKLSVHDNDKSEIQRLKGMIMNKDETIRSLKEKVDEFSKGGKEGDYEFYKRNYEEQKQRTTLEHELISNSLYDLALQFISFKNELVKNIKPNN